MASVHLDAASCTNLLAKRRGGRYPSDDLRDARPKKRYRTASWRPNACSWHEDQIGLGALDDVERHETLRQNLDLASEDGLELEFDLGKIVERGT